ncbi:DUF6203 family protein [Nonomuraea sp. GTA35]|uniref:DUF6203 family protein n=1 Tax=Nonomuraea sp. GTA35 TaxID=1676746 RepID=UPI0035C10A88
MRKLFKLLLARRMAGTPLGLAALVLGWFLARRRRRRHAYEAEHETERAGRHSRTASPARGPGRSRAASRR